jgi:hypothetical protein
VYYHYNLIYNLFNNSQNCGGMQKEMARRAGDDKEKGSS